MSLEDLTPEQQQQLRLGNILLKNPEIALKAKRLAKEAEPSLRIPEVELDDKLNAQASATQKQVEELEKKLLNETVERRRAERARQIEAAGLTVEEVEKLVVDEACTYETAMKMAKLQKETATPAAAEVAHGGVPRHAPLELRPAAEWRKLHGQGLKMESAKIAHSMVDDIIKQRRTAR